MNPFEETPASEASPTEDGHEPNETSPAEESVGAEPESPKPDSDLPDLNAPDSDAPDSDAPESDAPEILGDDSAAARDGVLVDSEAETHPEAVDEVETVAHTVDQAEQSDDLPAVDAGATETSEEGGEQDQDEQQVPGYEDNPNMNWFIVHTYSGFENKVSESLRTRAEAFGFAERLGQVLIPTEEVVEMRNGKKITSKRLLYPGYVLVQMEMDDDLWHQVKNTPRVTGFIGGGGKPVPLSATEVNSILFRQSTAAERPRPKLNFEKNETVRIVDGPFANFSGKVDEINMERNTLRVMVTIFGRSTPVELDFLQVEKIA